MNKVRSWKVAILLFGCVFACSESDAGVTDGASPGSSLRVVDAGSGATTGITPKGVVTPTGAPRRGAFIPDETIYVVEPEASLYEYRADDESIAATLPIGELAKVVDPSHCKADFDKNAQPTQSDRQTWVCLFTPALPGNVDDTFYAWAEADSFGREQPVLRELIIRYDHAQKEDRNARRKLAERAIALDPLSDEAEKRLIAVLGELGDRPAVAEAEKSFRRYRAHLPTVAEGDYPTVYFFDGASVVPFAAIVKGRIVRGVFGAVANSGEFLYVYSGGRRIGTVVTSIQFECLPPGWCAEKVPVKSVDLPKAPAETLSGLATNFLLPERTKPMPVITDRQEKIIRRMLKRQIVARYSGKTRAALLEAMGTGEPGSVRKAWTGVGQLSQDGRLYLFGQVLVGSTSDVHYASPGDEPVFGSLLVIAEQQSDRTFKAVAVPDLEKEDCYADGPLDVDGDGTDEIVLTCRAVEGPDSSGLLQRVGGHWVGEF